MLKTTQNILKGGYSKQEGMSIKVSNVIVLQETDKSGDYHLKLTENGNYQIMANHDLITISLKQMERIVKVMYPNIQKILGSKE